jgi:preprotein translocase subunit SecG
MSSVVIVVHLMIVLAMVGLVLLQRSEGGGLGMGGGGFLSSRGTANVLTRTTAILAAAFFVTSLALSILAGFDRRPSSIFGSGAQRPAAPAAPSAPAQPSAPRSGGVLDQLRGAPAGPQVPQSQ